MDISHTLKNFPIRLAITDYCNLKCFFCSNEGMLKEQRNTRNMNSDLLIDFLRILKRNGLKHISLTGGDPTIFSDLEKTITKINDLSFSKTFFHTNGVRLSNDVLDYGIKDFSKIAVSIHAVDFEAWKKITKGTYKQYDALHNNIENLAFRNLSNKVEIKYVPVKGYNDDSKQIKEMLDICSEYKFKFKFLNFEAIDKEQVRLIVPFNSFIDTLKDIGCEELEPQTIFRGQKDYLPAKIFQYKETKGVAIEIGCGKENVCNACYKSNEIFVDPGFNIKPCHITPFTIPLLDDIIEKNESAILKKIIDSRLYLHKSPGKNASYWSQDV